MTHQSIQGKIRRGIMGILIPAFVVTIVVVLLLTILQNRETSTATEKQIRASLLAKGKVLVTNNAQALAGMVGDNAYLAVQSLVANTVQEDEDVVYGVFMDMDRQAWVSASSANSSGVLEGRVILSDSASVWASTVQAFATRTTVDSNGMEVIEFAAAVLLDEEIAGWLRYGISTKNLYTALQTARQRATRALVRMVGLLLLLAFAAVSVAYALARRQAMRFSKPIQDLNAAANRIAGGNYQEQISISSDDEVGDLALSFENMRQTVQQYTEHLQELIDAKMRQVRAILDNIDQGLFTVNLDGNINDEYSLATNGILNLSDVSKVRLAAALRLGASQQKDWDVWVKLVQARRSSMRWEKLMRLAPVLEFDLHNGEDLHTIQVGYQPVLDGQGSLERIMVLVQDVTETRKIERIIAEEKQRHENEVTTILGLVNTLPEVIRDFFTDTDTRLGLIQRSLSTMQNESERARIEYPDGDPLAIDQNSVSSVYRDLHTIKGNAATYGFENLSRLAHDCEEILEALRPPIRMRTQDTMQLLREKLLEMQQERQDIDGISRKLRGGDQLVIHIAESKVQYLYSLARRLSGDPAIGRTNVLVPLFEACLSLRHIPLLKLVDKYRSMVERVAEKLGKKMRFECSPEALELPPLFFKPLNEAMVHILRNAIDHGIESPAERTREGKPVEGIIRVTVSLQESSYQLEIFDDGHGVDGDALAAKAVHMGFITDDKATQMHYDELTQLVFLPGLTTKEQASEISGRGVGMNAVITGLEALGGSISVSSRPLAGTTFVVEIPIMGPESLV